MAKLYQDGVEQMRLAGACTYRIEDESRLSNDGPLAPPRSGDHRAVTPEEMLWAAVLADAIAAVRGRTPNLRTRAAHYKSRAHAAAWFNSDAHEVGSFVFVCDVLSLDAMYIRTRLLRASATRRSVWCTLN
jgi:hypothetical protein